MPLTRSQARKRKKITQNTADDKINRGDHSLRSHRIVQELWSDSESESLEGFIMTNNQDGAWGGKPPNNEVSGMTHTPGSMHSFADPPYADIEEQELHLRAQIGLPPRTTATTFSNLAPRSSVGIQSFLPSMPVRTTSNLTATASPYVPTSTSRYSLPPTGSYRLSGFPQLNEPSESSTDLLLKALLVKLDSGFSGLNQHIRNQPQIQVPIQQPEMSDLTRVLSNLNLQVQALTDRLGMDNPLSGNPHPHQRPNVPSAGSDMYGGYPHQRPNVPRARPDMTNENYRNPPPYQHNSGNFPRHWKLKYNGDNNKLAVEFFCDQIEILQAANGTDWRDVIAAIPLFLEGEAVKWFYRFIKGNNIADWNGMKNAMIEYFRGSESTESLWCTLAKRKQGEREKFDDFYHAVLNIQDRITGGIPESQLIGILRENVKLDIQKCFVTYCPTSLSDFINKCRITDKLLHPFLYEKNIFTTRKISEVQVTESREDERIRFRELEAFDGRGKHNSYNLANTTCWNCDVVGHCWQICDKPLNIFCYWCGLKNVRSTNASNFRKVSHIKEPPPSAPPQNQ